MRAHSSSEKSSEARSPHRSLLLYVGMIGATVCSFFIIRHVGGDLVAPSPPSTPAGGGAAIRLTSDTLPRVLMALISVTVTARLLGSLLSRFGQPSVVGEVVAGILLGPSFLGRIAPDVAAFLVPAAVAPFLGLLSNLGVILYMFLIGLRVDLSEVRQHSRVTVAISHASIATPFVLGALLALILYPRLSSADVPFGNFALFCGVAMSITAFPVLARILADRRADTTRLGRMALTCAAVDDVTAWCLLAMAVSVVQRQAGIGLMTAGLTVAYLAFMLVVVGPLAERWLARTRSHDPIGKTALAVVLLGLLLSALATELIGIHGVFGAFALGAVIPAQSSLARDLIRRLEDFVVVLLLPAFFAYTGMRTRLGLVAGVEEWGLLALILVVACAGKFGGSYIAARALGLGGRESAALGVLMNTRGLMELIVLNIGLDLRVISPTLFAMLVLMAVLTTAATSPLLSALRVFPVAVRDDGRRVDETAPLTESRAKAWLS